MGRHSAPDDDDDVDTDVDTVERSAPIPAWADRAAPVPSRPRPGRHSRSAEPSAPPAPAEVSADAPVPAAPPPAAAAKPPAEPIARAEPAGQPGKPRPGAPTRTAPARTAPARAPSARTGPPGSPSRVHDDAPPRADDDTSPGITLIERALSTGRPAPAIAEPPVGEPAVSADETVQIQAIVDPVLDEAVPEAVTEKLRPVQDDPAAGPTVTIAAPHARPATDDPAGPQEKAKKAKWPKASNRVSDAPPPDTSSGVEVRTSDLALLRSNSAVRARVAAALVVPFVLYITVLLVLDAFEVRTALIWVWIPLVTAGVIGGLILDIAHREAAAARPPAREVSEPPGP